MMGHLTVHVSIGVTVELPSNGTELGNRLSLSIYKNQEKYVIVNSFKRIKERLQICPPTSRFTINPTELAIKTIVMIPTEFLVLLVPRGTSFKSFTL